MRRTIKFVFLACLVLSFTGRLYAQDKVVAIVNNEVVTQKDLADFLNFMRLQYSRQLEGKALEEKVNSMKADLLQRLIEDRLILQEAKREKLQVDSSRVKAKVDEVRKRYSSELDFEQDLSKQGLVRADLENKINEQLMMYTLVEKKVRNKIIIRPDEITTYYNQNKAQLLKPQ